jgi:hypothetical protein
VLQLSACCYLSTVTRCRCQWNWSNEQLLNLDATDANSNVYSRPRRLQTQLNQPLPAFTQQQRQIPTIVMVRKFGNDSCYEQITVSDNCHRLETKIIIAKVGTTIINPATYLFSTGTHHVVWTATDKMEIFLCNQIVAV